MAERQKYTNRLIHEKSPYLLQHAHNPVDWFPWGDEAFLAAKEQDKPIFLSIGYATCHWCHVMEQESFEDPEVAKIMNETFINIKLDREEHPEIDSLYMEFAQGMMSGSVGWPLNVILSPNLHPIFASTYLPPTSRHGMMGVIDLANHFKDVWKGEEKEKLVQQSEKIVEMYRESKEFETGDLPSKESVHNTAEIFFKIADPVYGGLKGAPKFPLAYQMNFLLRYSKQMKESRALFIVEKTLEMMRKGGIYDHVGGGFSRYSVDERWQIPHFEKMLYDNAILSFAYLESFLAEKNQGDKKIVIETLNYILRAMTSTEGGFFSAEDADSNGVEGGFYLFSLEEVKKILPIEDFDLASLYYDITSSGNFHGKNVLNTKETVEEFCEKYHFDPEELEEKLLEIRNVLFSQREKRPHPFKDDKILTSWNGIMISSLAEAGKSLGVKRYLEAARKGANFILDKMWDGKRLLHRYRGEAQFAANLEDYAYMTKGLLSLFQTTGNINDLKWAIHFAQIIDTYFKMPDGGYYQTDGIDPHVIVRKAQFADGAEPSGNSVHGENLLTLYQITRDKQWLQQAEEMFKVVSSHLGAYSPGYTYQVMNLLKYFDKKAPTFLIVCGDDQLAETITNRIYQSYLPHKAVIQFRGEKEILEILPYLSEYPALNNKTTLYLCTQNYCKEPTNDINKILDQIDNA